MKTVIVSLFLLVATVKDIRKKEISIRFLVIWFLSFCTYILSVSLLKKDFYLIKEAILGIIPGIASLILSYVSKEQIGYGDGLVLILLGMIEGYQKVIFIFLCGIFFLSIFSGVALCVKKFSKKYKVPFIPFLLAGYLVVLFL